MNNFEEKLKQVPLDPGIYIMRDETDAIIYVGKAKSLRKRLRQYFTHAGQTNRKVKSMVSRINDFEYIIVENEVESLILESNLIKDNHPKYNILLRDDKQYPYIKVTVNEEFPRVLKTRELLKDGAKYFGPYPAAAAVNNSIEIFERLYQLKTCSLEFKEGVKYRPCLNYFIGKCVSPCILDVDKKQYNENIQKIIDFLSGKDKEIINLLRQKMKEESENLNFESAAQIRDDIESLEFLNERQLMDNPSTRNNSDVLALAKGDSEVLVQIFFVRDGKIIGREHYFLNDYYNESLETIFGEFIKQFYLNANYIPKNIVVEEIPEDRELLEKWLSGKKAQKVVIESPKKGQKKKLVEMVKKNAIDMIEKYGDKFAKRERLNILALEEIYEELGLKKMPLRIEAFDISNISGVESVGSMVVFEKGDRKKSDYRKFRIKTVYGANDYASMEEILSRRFKRGIEEKKVEKLSSFTKFPDLIMMDGGKGQINIAKKVLDELGLDIEVCGLVKDKYHQTRGIIFEDREYNFKKDSRVYKMIYKIQEEAHRFAINYHKSRRSDKNFKSELDNIPGIGKIRKNNLMIHFKSIQKIKDAALEDLQDVKGMDRKSAENLFRYFHGEINERKTD